MSEFENKLTNKNITLSLTEIEAAFIFNALSFSNSVLNASRGLVQDSDFECIALFYGGLADSLKIEISGAFEDLTR